MNILDTKQSKSRIVPKLKENPADKNNWDQGGGCCKSNPYNSIDASQYHSSKFNQLAYDSVYNKYIKISIDKARAGI